MIPSQTKSYSHGTVDAPLLGWTIGEDLERAVERFSDREALVSCHQQLRYTYAELGDAVDRVACGLLAAGVAKGDRVGIWAPNCAEWVLVQYATARVGAVLVNINPAYRTHELAPLRVAPVGSAPPRQRARVQGQRLRRDGRRGQP